MCPRTTRQAKREGGVMTFNIPADWCVIAAKKERDAGDFTVGTGRGIKLEACSFCRGYELERQWCDHCNRSGIVKSETT